MLSFAIWMSKRSPFSSASATAAQLLDELRKRIILLDVAAAFPGGGQGRLLLSDGRRWV